MRPRTRTAVTVLLWLAAAAPAFAGRGRKLNASAIKQPARGTFKMREELKGRHPRLFFAKKDIPAIRRRAKGGSKWFLERAKKNFARILRGPKAKPDGWLGYLYGFWGLFAADMV